MKIAEIRELKSKGELAERLAAEVAAYDQMVLNHSISPLENPAQIKTLRRTIAQMKTVLNEKLKNGIRKLLLRSMRPTPETAIEEP